MHGSRELLNRLPLGVRETLPGRVLEGGVRVAGEKEEAPFCHGGPRLVDQFRIIRFLSIKPKRLVAPHDVGQVLTCSAGGTLDIQDSYSSTIRIAVPLIPIGSDGSKIGTATALVRYSSFRRLGRKKSRR
jgi:hypothetical protein